MGEGTESVDWRAVFVANPAPTCVVVADGRIAAANTAFAGLVGVEAESLDGVALDSVLTLDAAGSPRGGLGFLRLWDGETRSVPFLMTPLPDGTRVVSLTDATGELCFLCKVYSSREKFRTAIDDQSELICRFAPDLSITLVNRAFAALFGLPPRAMIDRHLRDLLPPATFDAVAAFLVDATPDAPTMAAEEFWPQEDGTERWISWRRYAVFDAAGQLVAVQSVGRDTTQRRRAETERVRLAAMVSRSPVVGLAWRTVERYPIDYATDNADRLGVDRAGLRAGRVGMLDLIHPDDAPAFTAWAEACPPAGMARPLTVRLAGAAGERWLSVSAWRSGDGTMEAVLLDVTEQRAASLALRERERRFKAIFDHTYEFVGLLTPDGRMIEANETALAFIQMPEEEVFGRYFWDTPWWRASVEQQERLKEAVVKVAQGETVRFETRHHGPNGQIIDVDFSLRPIRDETGAVVYLVPEGHDITHLKRTEAALLAAKREAEAANRSKTQFLAVMSHELRTPLNAVLGYSEVMQTGLFGTVENERYRGYIDAIHASGRHLLGIIDDILEVSRIELGVLELNEEEVCVADLVERVAQILVNRAGENGVELQVEVEPNLPTLRCDMRRVIQTLVNVGFNGIKFTRRGGFVRLEARRAEAGGIVFMVRDNGIGIAAEDRRAVWEPFTQAGNAQVRRGGGVGLGLAITRALVEAHGGSVGLESAPDRGTLVTLHFPGRDPRQDKAAAIA